MKIPKFSELHVSCMSLESGATFTVAWAVDSTDGRYVLGGFEVITTTAFNAGSGRQQLPEGKLVGVEVRCSTPGGLMGQSRCSAWLQSSEGVVNKPRFAIGEGPTTEFKPFLWTAGSGWINNGVDDVPGWFNIPDPAAGDEVAVTWAGIDVIEVNTIQLALFCDGTVANRFAFLKIGDARTPPLTIGSNITVTANGFQRYHFCDRIGYYSDFNSHDFIPLGRVGFAGADGINLAVTGMQAGDTMIENVMIARWRVGAMVF